MGTLPNAWTHKWPKAKIPDFPSREEAVFWLRAIKEVQGDQAPAAVAEVMTRAKLDADLRDLHPRNFSQFHAFAPRNILGCFATLFTPEELLLETDDAEYYNYECSAEGFRKWVLPFLSRTERAALRERARSWIVATHGPRQRLPEHCRLAALLGCHEEIRAVLRAMPDGKFAGAANPSKYKYFLQVQPLVFGLPSRAEVRGEFSRLGLHLVSAEQARDWIALTELEALEAIADGTVWATTAPDAARIAAELQRVDAPEAVATALKIAVASEAPRAGHEWLARHPFHAALGLVPIALAGGARAGAAREALQTLRRNPKTTAALDDVIAHLPPDQADWLRAEVFAPVAGESCLDFTRAELPADLHDALAAARPEKLPAWLPPGALPPVLVGVSRLGADDIALVLAALRSTSLASALPPVIGALKAVADRGSLDAFAWRVFEIWDNMGAPSKDRWIMGTVGLLGGDDCARRLTERVREWPGQSRRARAKFGLECLRAIGTDAALEALRGLAQWMKPEGLRAHARELLAG